ncbi:acetyl-CoA carboxylase biotin carboxyl carrier protein [Virgibacillus oceani]|uniref:Biotin carboxyl carrier protein of acetyl-CoA carboxylase n=1 Tax=Virgibacillus oceani TaxID=1479511 RepID=A0A917H176_9BACI|nr:acetyl-CoA carboxylase biotin carboxyl carrier protein [Virgibacillus oceani]GGG63951.1 acetyl-CoA carboxylase, biotin carboxyl carrier protein [Virgibacillus oceani]
MLKVQEIRELIKLIDQSSIDEFTYETNGTTVSMKKASENAGAKPVKRVETVEQPVETIKTEEPKVTVPADESKAVAGEPENTATVDYDYEIVSPMVGTLYSAASPEADSYVQKGSKVQKDTVVCIVEAMKLFNEIEAEVNGEIVEILVEDGELVEYGQPLFRVKTK